MSRRSHGYESKRTLVCTRHRKASWVEESTNKTDDDADDAESQEEEEQAEKDDEETGEGDSKVEGDTAPIDRAQRHSCMLTRSHQFAHNHAQSKAFAPT